MGLFGGIKADRLINQVVGCGDLESTSSVQAIDKLRSLGQTAVAKIIALLSTTSLDETEIVVKLLTRLVNRSTVQYFFDGLGHSDGRVVKGVMRALKGAHTIDPNRFLELLDNPNVSKPAILEILSAQKDVLHGEALLRYCSKLEHSDLVALFRIIEDIADESLVPKLISRIDAKDPVIRAQIAKVLGKFRGEAVQDALHRMLNDENKAVRLAALESLSRMDASMDVERLCQLIKDPDLRIQAKAIDAIVKLNHPRTVSYLLDPLQDESEYARRAAVEVLNEIGNVHAIKDLLVAIKDKDWWVRSRAADALGKIGGPRVVDAVIQLIKDDDEFIRRTAIEIINATKDARTYDTLVEALSDTDWWVRERAVDGLANLGNKNAVPVLLKLMEKERGNADLMVIIIRALGKLKATAAIQPIVQELKTGCEHVKAEALSALMSITNEEHASVVVESIIESTKHESTQIRQLANEVVQKLNVLRSYRPEEPTQPNVHAEEADDDSSQTLTMSGTVSRGKGSLPSEEVDPSKLQPDDVLADRYRFIKQVGKGAFGSVYLMEDLMVNEELILKFLNPQLASDENIIKRFVYELRFARRITHPNVIRIYDLITFGRSPAISMEYFPSHTLGAEIRCGKPMDQQRALRIIHDVCEGMTSAHQANVVHRDLKPSNILINDDEVKIVDFGVAAATSQMDTRLTRTGLLIGTPTYMAPEQVLGREVDSRTDIYSLGVIVYEMFTGKPPYTGGDSMAIMYQHVQGQPDRPQELNPQLSEALSSLILKAMASDPDQRFQSMDELQQSLDPFVA